MSFIRNLLARASLAVATVLPVRAPGLDPPTAPALVDPAGYLHVEVHVGVHRPATRPLTPEEWATARQLAEAHWDEHYQGLAGQLAAHTRRVRGLAL